MLTKTLLGGSGVSQVTSADYAMAYSLGEDVAGSHSIGGGYDLTSGYFSGYASGFSGTFALQGVTAGTTHIMEGGIQVGVPLNAAIQVAFSSPLEADTVASGMQVTALMDHLAQMENANVPWNYTYDVSGSTVILTPQGAWPGNTVIDITGNSTLRSTDGFGLGPSTPHGQFVTVLDPSQENVVLQPLPVGIVGSGSGALNPYNGATLDLDISQGSLSDYSYVLVSQDPLHAPLAVDPKILQTATAKAQASGGAYQTPLAMQEIAAFNVAGNPMSLSKSMSYSYSYQGNLMSSSGLPVRSSTLSLWALDTSHALWVKLPDTHSNSGTLLGPVSQFSVFALMGSADTDASSVIVFPIPWRPHGPNAGTGSGQTGTEADGITFSNLPSECKITIYTVSGEKVKELQHSDLTGTLGQEKWDGRTSGGGLAASGVYLWRVESSSDGKNGKLMIIR